MEYRGHPPGDAPRVTGAHRRQEEVVSTVVGQLRVIGEAAPEAGTTGLLQPAEANCARKIGIGRLL
ncbi:hypothetical protein NSPZN2_10130 [Nitrospira defluvii]|uniref:Uncharacterized protein n=1 Tax=Nitrospira defluvii TaxID=330214 RepID=A0ABM8QC54_9BACT|nr:hypothetical protein NSPZN2_10130 [Nitrospira defluvii]